MCLLLLSVAVSVQAPPLFDGMASKGGFLSQIFLQWILGSTSNGHKQELMVCSGAHPLKVENFPNPQVLHKLLKTVF